jgi:hypothetical protein
MTTRIPQMGRRRIPSRAAGGERIEPLCPLRPAGRCRHAARERTATRWGRRESHGPRPLASNAASLAYALKLRRCPPRESKPPSQIRCCSSPLLPCPRGRTGRKELSWMATRHWPPSRTAGCISGRGTTRIPTPNTPGAGQRRTGPIRGPHVLTVTRRMQAEFRPSTTLNLLTPETPRWGQCPLVAQCGLVEFAPQTAFGSRCR